MSYAQKRYGPSHLHTVCCLTNRIFAEHDDSRTQALQRLCSTLSSPAAKSPRVSPSPSPLPSLTSSIALSTTLCPLPPSKITFCALPTGVSRPPTTAVAVLALHGVVTPRDWGVSGGEAVGHGVSGRSFFYCFFIGWTGVFVLGFISYTVLSDVI